MSLASSLWLLPFPMVTQAGQCLRRGALPWPGRGRGLGASSSDRRVLSPRGLQAQSPGVTGALQVASQSPWFSWALAVTASQVERQERAPSHPRPVRSSQEIPALWYLPGSRFKNT